MAQLAQRAPTYRAFEAGQNLTDEVYTAGPNSRMVDNPEMNLKSYVDNILSECLACINVSVR